MNKTLFKLTSLLFVALQLASISAWNCDWRNRCCECANGLTLTKEEGGHCVNLDKEGKVKAYAKLYSVKESLEQDSAGVQCPGVESICWTYQEPDQITATIVDCTGKVYTVTFTYQCVDGRREDQGH